LRSPPRLIANGERKLCQRLPGGACSLMQRASFHVDHGTTLSITSDSGALLRFDIGADTVSKSPGCGVA